MCEQTAMRSSLPKTKQLKWSNYVFPPITKHSIAGVGAQVLAEGAPENVPQTVMTYK